MAASYDGLSPGDSMIVRALPCVECDNGTVQYVRRRLCAACYQHVGRGQGRLPIAELFDLYVARDWVPDCWVWLGHISSNGYGKAGLQYAHRLSHELHRGPIPEGLVIDHLCRNRWCVNPAHLEAVTQQVNVLRGEGADKTHCVHGHGYTEANTCIGQGKRSCRQCRNLRRRRTRGGLSLSEERS